MQFLSLVKFSFRSVLRPKFTFIFKRHIFRFLCQLRSVRRGLLPRKEVSKKDTQNSMEIKNDIFDVHESNGKGLGAFAGNKILEGTEIVTEKPSVIGPKQTSSFVCVDCFDYIDEQTGT